MTTKTTLSTTLRGDGIRVTVLRPTSLVDGTGTARDVFERVWARLPRFREGNATRVLEADGGLFLKGQRIEPRVRVKSLRKARRLLRETRFLGYMDAVGTPVPEIVAYGAERRGGLPVRTFLLLRHVSGAADLRALLSRTPAAGRHDIWEPLGRTVAGLHSAALFHRDLTARNVLVARGDDGVSVQLIDCPRAEWGRVPLRRGYLRRSDLLRLGRSVLAAGGEPCEVRALLDAYGAPDADELVAQARRAAAARRGARARAKLWVTLGL